MFNCCYYIITLLPSCQADFWGLIFLTYLTKLFKSIILKLRIINNVILLYLRKQRGDKMDFSNGELTVMEMLWKGDCLDENGEIQALELSKLLNEQYGFGKTSCYTFFGRLLEKGAITRRYPKYTIKPLISREDALRKQQQEVIDRLFKGSIINVCQAFFSEKKVSKKELEEMRKLIDSFDAEE